MDVIRSDPWLEVHIEVLVFDGFDPTSSDGLREAVRSGLARALAGGLLVVGPVGTPEADVLDAGQFELPRTSLPNSVGDAVGKGIAKAIRSEPTR